MRIILSGIGGRIGRAMYSALLKNDEFSIVCGVDIFAPQRDFDVPVFKSVEEVNVDADVIIDFSNPAALDSTIKFALQKKLNLVIATTGHTPEQEALIENASRSIAVFKASNMSLGVNLIMNLSRDAAKFLGADYDIEIIEQHHNQKLDSPSGTALSLASAINEVLDNRLDYVYGRSDAAQRRSKSELGIHAVRGGTIIGKHDVMFIGQGETITLSHESNAKEVFVYGSLRAAKFISDKSSGLYDMNSILGSFYSVTSVSSEMENDLVTISGTTSDVFNQLLKELNKNNVNLDMISQSFGKNGTVNVSFTMQSKDRNLTQTALDKLKISYDTIKDAAKLTTEGAGMQHRSGVAMEVLNILKDSGATVYAITTSETKISLCINSSALASSEKALKKYYGLK